MPRGTRRLPLVYSCSGCSSAAQMANYVALCLNRDRYAEMSCIAGVGGDVPSLVRVAKSARPVVAIDGCKLHCVRSCLSRHDVEPTLHLTLTEIGILKRFHAEFSEDEATGVFHQVIAALRARGLARPETADEIERATPTVRAAPPEDRWPDDASERTATELL